MTLPKLPPIETIKTIALTVLTAALILFIILQQKGCNDMKQQKALMSAYEDTVKQTRNSLGQQTSSIAVLQTNVHDLLALNAGKDSMLGLLQQEVKANRAATAVIVAKIEALDKGSSSTSVVIQKGDTVRTNDSTVYIYPTYKTQWTEKWSHGMITADRDSIFREITYNEEYSTNLIEKGNDLFKPKVYTVQWTNLNPNANTVGLRSYSVEPKRKNFFLGVGVGYGLSVFPKSPIQIDNGIQIGIYVGYQILQF